MTKKILVTGASGSVGRNIAMYLADMGYAIIGTWNHHVPTENSGCVKYLRIDLGNKEEVERLFETYSFDVIIHLAVQVRSPQIKDYLRNSIGMTEHLLTVSSRVRTFVYTSSFSIYGDVAGVVNENSARLNLDDYGVSKYICERMVEDAKIENRVVIRLPRMLGENIDLTYPWVPKLAKELMQNKEVRYFNPNLLYNNLAHTDTLGKFLKKIIDEDATEMWRGFHVMGIGSAAPIRIIDIIQQLKEGLNSTSALYESKELPTKNACFHVDISRAEKYGYEPWTVRETLSRFIENIKEGKSTNGK